MEEVIIIGSGVSGYSSAIYCGRGGLKPIVMCGDLPFGLLSQTTEVENFPGFKDGINGFDLVSSMSEQAEKFGTIIQYETVIEIIKDEKSFRVITNANESVSKSIIIAFGSEHT